MNDIFIKKISFTKRPIPLPADYRPMYKIALIVMILKLCCRAETSTLLKLHLFSWALASEENMNQLNNYIRSNYKDEFSIWSIEPALNRALQLAVAEDICDLHNGKNYKLTDKGDKFFKMINADKELFKQEKEFLLRIGKNSITDSRILQMTKNWSFYYA